MSRFSPITLVLLFFLIESCSIEEVKTPTKGYLVVASDFLEEKDSNVFKSFSKQKNITVKIKNLSSDSIIEHFKKFQYNSKFDAVLLKSSYDLYRLSNVGALNALPKKIDINIKNIGKNYNWLAIGYDPYVFDFGDSLAVETNYSLLKQKKKWKPVLSKKQLVPFYASLVESFGRNKMNDAVNFISKMNELQKWDKKDSLKLALYTLNKFSESHVVRNQYSFPNQDINGAYYDCIGFAIISHSKRYSEAETLIYYLVRQHNNQGFTGKLSVFPLIDPNGRSDFDYQNNYPKLSSYSPRSTASQFRNVNRVLKKIKKDQSSYESSNSSSPPPSSRAFRD